MSRAFHRYSLFTLAAGVVLIWWGAGVTSKDVGLAVPDWITSFGYWLFPPGWMNEPALFWEHGHRLVAQTVGFLVLGMYFWAMKRHGSNPTEAVILILCGGGYIWLVHQGHLGSAGLILLLGFAWLIMAWIGQRWHLLRGLTTLALMLVILQASLGGLRVLKMSDTYGIVHGTLGQLLYCLLVFIAYASSRTWDEGVLRLHERTAFKARIWGAVLFSAVFIQLILGATVRHTQRARLAAHDILTTNGDVIPPVASTDAFLLFLHKYWGFTTAVLVIIVARWAHRWLVTLPRVRFVPVLLLYLPVIQVSLGIFVILTGRSELLRNFHVLNGLALLALSFLLVATLWGSYLRTPRTDSTTHG